MLERAYQNGWSRGANWLVYDRHWQLPAKTELWSFELFMENKTFLPKNIEFIFFPWASLIDAIDHNNIKIANELLSALDNIPPRFGIKRVTVAQHIFCDRYVEVFKRAKVSAIFWSHKRLNEHCLSGVKILPYCLYPVMAMKYSTSETIPLDRRKYLFNFIGSYQEGLYLSKIRQELFKLKGDAVNSIYIRKRNEWHFEGDVYRNQINGLLDGELAVKKKLYEEKEYVHALSNSKFTLCPSGSGPNSIRIWESLLFGSIPVILSDGLDLINESVLSDIVVKFSENDFSGKQIFSRLSEFDFSEYDEKLELVKENYIKMFGLDLKWCNWDSVIIGE
ncbi:exostosin domain-containing protein [Vibrio parahaemolyticus]|uniref:exostosin domain-containing protein n=1 Tax=Vibrio parahaemolyticus TaxID=670 RepID=UPI001B81884F|nr:exostosin family protein [Vibrio parahaemolyticus]EGR1577626.1 hypothetical protein [Vibrio parahaemolyticus]EHH1173268.1 exostosin family protein [Vibrio parahaemolyticus]MDF4257616.1 exostosin family protein [Vibrio parahaemolyticus]MDF4262531.1 exostosin family protein [Vibrio parahaemolyticus]MDF4324688.1 exostosin family protein [Vibrio parahaemolyticus]